eukprot:scaffold56070_cov25-Prasinocladus_malaysianus.AAC.1
MHSKTHHDSLFIKRSRHICTDAGMALHTLAISADILSSKKVSSIARTRDFNTSALASSTMKSAVVSPVNANSGTCRCGAVFFMLQVMSGVAKTSNGLPDLRIELNVIL